MYAQRPALKVVSVYAQRFLNVCLQSETCNQSVQCMFREIDLYSEFNTCVKSGFSACSESLQCMLIELDL